jgi:tetratricopeptide (TPR) repeat protein
MGARTDPRRVASHYDVFISYAHSDAERVKPIHDALVDHGLRTWFDEKDVADFTSITRAIELGLSRSKALLAFYSATYPTRRPCQWELTAAFLAAQAEGDPLRRVLVVNPEPGTDHLQPVELADGLFQGEPGSAGAGALAAKVEKRVAALDGALGALRALAPPRWFGQQAVGSTRFVGRVRDMWRVHSALRAADVGLITGARGAAFTQVRGLGGIGKSLLAEEYALRFGAAYPGGVFWLRAYGNDDAKAALPPEAREAERKAQILDFAVELHLPVEGRSPAEVQAAMARALAIRDEPYLWIVDDVPTNLDRDELHRWLAPGPSGKTLLTTRTREYGATGASVDLGVLEEEDAWQLLTAHRKPVGRADTRAARALVRELGAHAQAVDIAGAALAAERGLRSFAEYRSALARADEDELELAAALSDALPNGHERSIAAVLTRSVEQLSDEGLDFLRLASVLAVEPISPRFVAFAFAKVDELDDSAARRRAARGIKDAHTLSLAELIDEDHGLRQVHTLVSRTVRLTDRTAGRREALRSAAIVLLEEELSSIAQTRVIAGLETSAAHARQLTSGERGGPVARLVGAVARYDYARGDFTSARSLWEQQLELNRGLLGAEHRDTLTSEQDLASALLALGEFESARELGERTLGVRRRVLGEEDPDTLASMNNLGAVFRSQGNYQAARAILEEAIAIEQRAYGDDHLLSISARSNLAGVLAGKGDFPAARALVETARDAAIRTLGEEHPRSLTLSTNLALIIHAEGSHADAGHLIERVCEIQQRVLGDEHPDTLVSLSTRAETLRALGDLDAALELHRRCLATRRRVLGDEHADTITSINMIAETYRAQGDVETARTLHRQALATRLRVFGDEDPDAKRTIAILREIESLEQPKAGTEHSNET